MLPKFATTEGGHCGNWRWEAKVKASCTGQYISAAVPRRTRAQRAASKSMADLRLSTTVRTSHDVSTIESSIESVVEPHQIWCCLMQMFQVRCRMLSDATLAAWVHCPCIFRLDAGSCTQYNRRPHGPHVYPVPHRRRSSPFPTCIRTRLRPCPLAPVPTCVRAPLASVPTCVRAPLSEPAESC
jgi:hypothetical protein